MAIAIECKIIFQKFVCNLQTLLLTAACNEKAYSHISLLQNDSKLGKIFDIIVHKTGSC